MSNSKVTKHQPIVDENATQLTKPKSLDPKNIVFSELSISKIPDSTLTCSRVFLSIKNPDGSIGDLIIPTSEIYSSGPTDNINVSTKQKDGYKMSLSLFSKNGPSAEEKQFVDAFNAVSERCKEHLFEHKDELGLELETKNELRNLNPIWYKKENKKIVEGALPYLFCKVWVQKARYNKDGSLKEPEKIKTNFYHTVTGEQLDMFAIFGKPCYTRAAIKFESVFIGNNKAYLQVKLYECLIKPTGAGGLKRLFDIPETPREVVDETEATPQSKRNIFDNEADDVEEEQETGSIKDDQEEDDDVVIEPEPEPEPPKVVKKIIKRVVKKKD